MKPSAKKPESLEARLLRRIARKRGDVFMREDFRDLGSSAQIGRALRALIQKGKLLRFGYGIYIRAEPSVLDGKPAPAKTVRELATEALARLGAEVTNPARNAPTIPAGANKCRPAAWSQSAASGCAARSAIAGCS